MADANSLMKNCSYPLKEHYFPSEIRNFQFIQGLWNSFNSTWLLYVILHKRVWSRVNKFYIFFNAQYTHFLDGSSKKKNGAFVLLLQFTHDFPVCIASDLQKKFETPTLVEL